MAFDTIKDAIKNAFETITSKEKETEKAPEPTSEETKKEEVKDEEEEVKEDKKESSKDEDEEPKLDPKIVKEALKLYDILNDPDPKNVGAALKAMVLRAEKAGIEIEGITAKEQREVTKDILEALKEELPEENRELIDALGPALRKIIKLSSEGSEAKIKDLEKELNKYKTQTEAEKYASTLQSILTKDKYEGHLPAMEKLMETIQPVDGVSEEKYLDTLLKLAKAEKGERTRTETKAKKTEQNAKEATPSSSNKGDNVVILDKAVDLKEAIRLAREGKTVKYQAG